MIALLLACQAPAPSDTNDAGADSGADTAEDTDTGSAAPVAWNFLVFMNGDNDLEDYVVHDLNELEAGVQSDDMNVLVQADRTPDYDDSDGDWTGVRRYRIEPDSDIKVVRSPVLTEMGELDMGDPAVLSEFLSWAAEEYPAEHTALVLWDHGSGWQLVGHHDDETPPPPPGISWDETDGGFISIANGELAGALAPMADAHGKFELIAFDACNMATWEVAVALAPYGRAMEAAETTVGWEGIQYTSALTFLSETPDATGQMLATQMAEDEVKSGQEMTASAIDLDHIDELAAAIDAIAVAALAEPRLNAAVLAARTDAGTADKEWHDYYIDIGSFAKEFAVNAPDDATLGTGVADALASTVLGAYAKQPYLWTTGLYGMMDANNNLQVKRYHEGEGARWAQLTHWDELMQSWVRTPDDAMVEAQWY